MADKKIGDLADVTNVALLDSDSFPIARLGSETFKISIEELDKRYSISNAKYFGDPDTDGTWRFRVDAGNMLFEVRKLGVYVLKQELEP